MKACVILLLCLLPLVAADEVVFQGRALVRVDADGKDAKLTELSTDAGMKYGCRIVKRGRSYAWASRDNRRLDRVEAGDFIYYVSPEGSGYVKVLGPSQRGDGFDYVEHVTAGFKTLTYWGRTADRTDPVK